MLNGSSDTEVNFMDDINLGVYKGHQPHRKTQAILKAEKKRQDTLSFGKGSYGLESVVSHDKRESMCSKDKQSHYSDLQVVEEISDF